MRIDIIMSIDGVTFANAWPKRATMQLGDSHFWLISKEDLIANKRASGRPQDQLDLHNLLNS